MITKNGLIDIDFCLSKAGIGSGHRVADLGCGRNGYFVFNMAERVGNSGRVYAVDVKKEAVEELQRRAKLENKRQIQTLWSDIEIMNSIGLDSGAVDVAMIVNTMYELSNHGMAMREASRILHSEGLLVIVDWKRSDLHFGPAIERRLAELDLKEIAHRSGLDLVEQFAAGDYHFGLIFRKI